MVTERHRLARLEMGEAGHDGVGMLVGAGDQRILERVDPGERLVDRAAHPQLEVGRDLVVARAGGVEAARDRPDQLGQAVLDVHVDVFERGVLDQLAVGDLGGDLLQSGVDGAGVLGRDDALRGKHRGVRSARGDVFAPQSLVDGDRGIYLAHHRGRAAREPAAPHAIGIIRAADRPAPDGLHRARRVR